ncbi:unnamed protein product, partial [Meganyctiphanes norvegica]
MTNVTPRILSHVGKNLHMQKYHPLSHLRQRIVNYMYKRYLAARGNPRFSVHDQIHPVVTVEQNFDTLLTPKDHVSRKKSDNYYVNENCLLRAHTSAHQVELIRMGFDNFLVVGDVYRRDEIDSSHYPVFHQCEGVRLCTKEELYGSHVDMDNYHLFESTERNEHQQGVHNRDAVILLEKDLKHCLQGLATSLFGPEIQLKWDTKYYYKIFTKNFRKFNFRENISWQVKFNICFLLFDCGISEFLNWAYFFTQDKLSAKIFIYTIPKTFVAQKLYWSGGGHFLNLIKFSSKRPTRRVSRKGILQFITNNFVSFWSNIDCMLNFYITLFFATPYNIGEIVEIYWSDLLIQNRPIRQLFIHCHSLRVIEYLQQFLLGKKSVILNQKLCHELTANINVMVK